jgi:hypothetical protein
VLVSCAGPSSSLHFADLERTESRESTQSHCSILSNCMYRLASYTLESMWVCKGQTEKGGRELELIVCFFV